jgi:hypothetical protein
MSDIDLGPEQPGDRSLKEFLGDGMQHFTFVAIPDLRFISAPTAAYVRLHSQSVYVTICI